MKKVLKSLVCLTISLPMMAISQDKPSDDSVYNDEPAFKSVENSRSLLSEFQKFDKKQENKFHPSLLTYEKDLIPQGEETFLYHIELKDNNRILYNGEFDLKNSTLFSFYTAMNQSHKEQIENSKKGREDGGQLEAEKVVDSSKFQTVELSLMLHAKKDSNNLISQFFYEGMEKEATKELVVGKANDRLNGNQSIIGPDANKDRSEIIIRHRKGNPTTFTWRDYTFNVKAK